MGRFIQFLSLIVALALGFSIGAGVGWLNGQVNPVNLGGSFGRTPSSRSQAFSSEFKITGIIDILPELRSHLKEADTMMIVVTRPGEKDPLAVKRIYPVSFPFLYTLGAEDRAGSTLPVILPHEVEVRVHVGDLVGKPSGGTVTLPARDLPVLIDGVAEDHPVVK